MKQEELNNLEDEETPEQEEASAALKKIAEGLEGGDKKISRRGFLRGALKATAGFTVIGKAAEALAKDEEKGGDDKSKEERKKNVGFLRGVFQKISGGGIGKDEKSGNLIIHMGGGKYNAIENKELNKLTDAVGPRREKIEMLNNKLKAAKKPEEKHKYFRLIEAENFMANSTVRTEINTANHPIKVEDLPPSLKDFERAREEMVKGMSEGSIVQPINPDAKNK